MSWHTHRGFKRARRFPLVLLLAWSCGPRPRTASVSVVPGLQLFVGLFLPPASFRSPAVGVGHIRSTTSAKV